VQRAPRLHDAKTLCTLRAQSPRQQSPEAPTWPFRSSFWVSLHPLTLNPDPRAELACVLPWFLPPHSSPAQEVSQYLHLGLFFVFFFVFVFSTNGCKIRQMRRSSSSLVFPGGEFPHANLEICFCSTWFHRKQGSWLPKTPDAERKVEVAKLNRWLQNPTHH